MSLTRSLGCLGLVIILAFAFAAHAANRPATAADCAKLATESPGIPCDPGQTPYDPNNPFIGDEAADATKFLLERNGTGTRGTECYNGDQTMRITKLNPQFKIGLAKAIAEMEKLYGGREIIQSGFRCDGTDGNHPKGCAVDIIYASCKAKGGDGWRCSSDRFDSPEQKWIDANGKNAPYNIHLRLRYAPEGHHVEPVNTKDCVTGATVGSGNPPGSPTSDFANAIRQALGVQQQPAQQPPLPPQPLPQQQSPLNNFNQPMPTPIPIATSSDTSDTSSGPSIADKLEKLANGDTEKTPPTQVGTSVPLVINGKDVGVIAGTKKADDVPSTAGIGGSITQNTFATEDLSNQGVHTGTQSAFVRILASIKATLLQMLQYLKPFGSRPAPDTTEYSD